MSDTQKNCFQSRYRKIPKKCKDPEADKGNDEKSWAPEWPTGILDLPTIVLELWPEWETSIFVL